MHLLLLLAATISDHGTVRWPDRYALYTLPSGHTYKIFSIGAVTGSGGKHLGLGITYWSDARTFAQLETAANELFELARASADEHHEESVVVQAKLGFDPEAPASRSTDWNLGFIKSKTGEWSRLKEKDDEAAVFPRPSLEVSRDERDLTAQKQAEKEAVAFLAVIDKGGAAETWDALSPELQQQMPRDVWARGFAERRAPFGAMLSRKRSAVVQVGVIGQRRGRFVSLRYRTRFAKQGSVEESVSLEQTADGKWRVAGYGINPPL
ncbi:MAG TPA: DUF4019 domain-containing protein [Myxococcales bacterium]|nr:DUF4019 domain-containing protein [Myxococcales bacterium]